MECNHNMKKLPVFYDDSKYDYTIVIKWLNTIGVKTIAHNDLKNRGNGIEALYFVNNCPWTFLCYDTKLKAIEKRYVDVKVINIKSHTDAVWISGCPIVRCDNNDITDSIDNYHSGVTITEVTKDMNKRIWKSFRLMLIGGKNKGNLFSKLPKDMLDEICNYL